VDEVGIDVQVISHGAPSTQRLYPETAVRLDRNANDRLAQAIAVHPSRVFDAYPDVKIILGHRDQDKTPFAFQEEGVNTYLG
jgi:predicted TIM-barrel fold metal-dependent hydrolase